VCALYREIRLAPIRFEQRGFIETSYHTEEREKERVNLISEERRGKDGLLKRTVVWGLCEYRVENVLGQSRS